LVDHYFTTSLAGKQQKAQMPIKRILQHQSRGASKRPSLPLT